MKLVDNWQKSYKWFSVNIPIVGTSFLGAWIAMPDSLRDSVPHRYIEAITAIVFVGGVIGRLIKQGESDADISEPDNQ